MSVFDKNEPENPYCYRLGSGDNEIILLRQMESQANWSVSTQDLPGQQMSNASFISHVVKLEAKEIENGVSYKHQWFLNAGVLLLFENSGESPMKVTCSVDGVKNLKFEGCEDDVTEATVEVLPSQNSFLRLVNIMPEEHA
jgi:hypothetical protein